MAITKKQIMEALNAQTFNEVTLGDITVTPEDIKEFIEKSIVQIDARAAKAAEKAAEKKVAGDEMRAQVKAVLSETPMTIAEIVDAMNNEDVTNAKVVARLTQLVKTGEVVKNDIKVDGRSLKTYVLA